MAVYAGVSAAATPPHIRLLSLEKDDETKIQLPNRLRSAMRQLPNGLPGQAPKEPLLLRFVQSRGLACQAILQSTRRLS